MKEEEEEQPAPAQPALERLIVDPPQACENISIQRRDGLSICLSSGCLNASQLAEIFKSIIEDIPMRSFAEGFAVRSEGGNGSKDII